MELVYSSLKKAKNMNVYKKEEFPDDLHYKKNVRFGDLLILADVGYMMYLKQNDSDNHFPSKNDKNTLLNS